MFVKITVPHDDGNKYEMYETPSVRFESRPWAADLSKMAHYAFMIVDGKPYDALVPGHVYVMNNEGKTIDQWSPNAVSA